MPLPTAVDKATKALALLMCGAAAIYGVLGLLQAGSIYQGLRAIWNANFWSALVFVSLVCAAIIATPSIAFSKPQGGVPGSTYFWLTLAAIAAWPIARRLIALDSCLDAGGSYDAIQGQCSVSLAHPYVALYRTHGLFMVMVAISLVLACTSYVSSKRARKPTPSAA